MNAYLQTRQTVAWFQKGDTLGANDCRKLLTENITRTNEHTFEGLTLAIVLLHRVKNTAIIDTEKHAPSTRFTFCLVFQWLLLYKFTIPLSLKEREDEVL